MLHNLFSLLHIYFFSFLLFAPLLYRNIKNNHHPEIQNNQFDIIWLNFNENLIIMDKEEWGDNEVNEFSKLVESSK